MLGKTSGRIYSGQTILPPAQHDFCWGETLSTKQLVLEKKASWIEKSSQGFSNEVTRLDIQIPPEVWCFRYVFSRYVSKSGQIVP